jgi:CCR4-NOT transcription complex subunit 6
MFVEYLFEINPLTFLLIMLSMIFLTYKNLNKNVAKTKREYHETMVDYKVYNKIDDKNLNDTVLVMSYNILSCTFTKVEWFPYCQPEYLHPKYRAPRILNEIERVNADVLFLQECDHDLFLEFYKPNLEAMGYNVIFKSTNSSRIVTVGIAYKKKLFREENVVFLNLDEELDKLDDSFIRHKEALLVTLKQNSTGKKILVANTHLFWNADYEYVKYGQMSRIIKYIEKNYKDLPIIMGGDMNSTPSSNVLKYVYKKAPEVNMNIRGDYNKNKKFMEHFWNEHKHNLNLRSAYDIYKVGSNKDYEDYAENHPDFSTYTHEFVGTIDYILYNQNKIEVAELLKLPTHDIEVKSNKLPNSKYPSDHLKIGARLRLL